jgi:hypothetical protein
MSGRRVRTTPVAAHEACEYPWEDAWGMLHVPAERGFGALENLHRHRAGSTFLKIVATAATELGGGPEAAP